MQKNENHYDVIVIGGGSMGLATAYELSKRNVKILVLEQYTFINQLGSSAGVSRQFRIPYPDEYMVQMAVDAIPYWDELQKHTNVPLMDKVGTLWFGDPTVQSTEGNIAEAEKAMDAADVSYTTLTSKEIEEQYHFTNLPDEYSGLFQADGASINLRATLNTLYDLTKNDPNITLLEESPVTNIDRVGELNQVTTPNGVFTGKKMVIAPGPYINNVLKLLNFTIDATYWNMSSAYFKKTDPTIQYPTWFVFQNAIGKNGNQFYGFPEVDWDHPDYIRVAPDFVMKPLADPNYRSLVPSDEELAYTSAWVKENMKGLDPTPHFTSTCLIALSNIPNKEMIIDFAPTFVPHNKDIVVYGTGWGAKFIPFLGKILSDLAIDGYTDYDITPFEGGFNYYNPS